MTAPTPLSPESRLVFRGADSSCPATECAALADAVADWEDVAFVAEREHATASLWRALGESNATVPPDVMAHFRKRAMVSDFRMQCLSEGLGRIAGEFGRRGIPLLLLKGAAVGALRDPSFRSRPMTDIDVLVHAADVAGASAALLSAGWTQTTDPVLQELLADHHHLPPFTDPKLPGTRLELHVALLPAEHSFDIDEGELWRAARPAAAAFAGALVPAPEHLLLHACIHFAWQHAVGFAAWRTFRTVAMVTADPAFDWERFTAIALSTKAMTSCYWTLRLASRMAGIESPAAVLARLAPPTMEPLQRALERHFIAALVPGEGQPSPSIRLSHLLWRAAIRPRSRGQHSAGNHELDERWKLAGGGRPPETIRARIGRHAAEYRAWWVFVTHTLLGR